MSVITTFTVLRAQYRLNIVTREGVDLGRPGVPLWEDDDRVRPDYRPVPFYIIAESGSDALSEASRISDPPPDGWGWVFRITEVRQEQS